MRGQGVAQAVKVVHKTEAPTLEVVPDIEVVAPSLSFDLAGFRVGVPLRVDEPQCREPKLLAVMRAVAPCLRRLKRDTSNNVIVSSSCTGGTGLIGDAAADLI